MTTKMATTMPMVTEKGQENGKNVLRMMKMMIAKKLVTTVGSMEMMTEKT